MTHSPASTDGVHSDDPNELHKEYSNKGQFLSPVHNHRNTSCVRQYQSAQPGRLPKYRLSVDSSGFLLLYHTDNNVPNRYVRNGTGFLFRHSGKKHYASDNRDTACFLHESPHALFRSLHPLRKYPTGSMYGYSVGSTSVFRLLTHTIHQYTDPAND